MTDSNLTKQALAKSLKELMHEKPFEKITISDIAGRCGLNRLTFYYHFKDKFDLMNWIYYTETAQIMTQNLSLDDWTATIRALCYYMQDNKSFYIKALSTTGQNSFPEYLLQYIRDITGALVKKRKDIDKANKKRVDFFIEFCSLALIGLIVRWAQNGMEDDPGENIEMIKAIIDGTIMHELIEPETSI